MFHLLPIWIVLARLVHVAGGGMEGSLGDESGPGAPNVDQANPAADDGETASEEDDAEEGDTEEEALVPDQVARQLTRTRGQAAKYRRERNEARDALTAVQGELDALRDQVATVERSDTAPAEADPVAVAEARVLAERRRGDRLAAALGAGVSLAGLDALDALAAADDVAGMQAALERARSVFSIVVEGNPRPPEQPSTPLTLDEQIIQAQAAGKLDVVLALKARKALAARG